MNQGKEISRRNTRHGKKSNEAKAYWNEREARQKEFLSQCQSGSGASVTESISSSGATSSSGSNTTSSDSTTSVGMDSNEVMQLIISNIVPINNENTFRINDVNVLQLFHSFQDSLETSPLTYKSHICHILLTSGIRLVKKHQLPDLAKLIDNNTTHMMLKDTREQIGIHSQNFSRDVFIRLMEIVQQCITEQITMIKAIQQLLVLIDEEGNAYQNKDILYFKTLIEQLSNDSFDSKEFELTTRLIQSILLLLFEDKVQ